MDLDAITVFVKVVQAGSFSGAARLLHMPNTTVSAKVAALEKRLGVSLLLRTTRKLHVTEAGEQYFRHCVNAVHEVELAEAALQSTQEKPNGVMKITAPVDLGHTLLPKITQTFLTRHPEVNVDLIITNRQVDLVGEGVDLAIRTGKLKDSSLVARRFFDLQVSLWASPSYVKTNGQPKHPRNLDSNSLIGFAPFKSIVLTNGKTEARLTATSRINSDDLETIKALLILGEGVGSLPDFLAKDASQAGTLVQVLPQWRLKPGGTFYFVYAGHKYATPKVQAFIQTALDMV